MFNHFKLDSSLIKETLCHKSEWAENLRIVAANCLDGRSRIEVQIEELDGWKTIAYEIKEGRINKNYLMVWDESIKKW